MGKRTSRGCAAAALFVALALGGCGGGGGASGDLTVGSGGTTTTTTDPGPTPLPTLIDTPYGALRPVADSCNPATAPTATNWAAIRQAQAEGKTWALDFTTCHSGIYLLMKDAANPEFIPLPHGPHWVATLDGPPATTGGSPQLEHLVYLDTGYWKRVDVRPASATYGQPVQVSATPVTELVCWFNARADWSDTTRSVFEWYTASSCGNPSDLKYATRGWMMQANYAPFTSALALPDGYRIYYVRNGGAVVNGHAAISDMALQKISGGPLRLVDLQLRPL